jgi:uncharacterized membrane protein YfcA
MSFIAQTMNASLGMGYGTIAVPIFILLGFEPLEVIPSMLSVQVLSGIFASISHYRHGNVDYSRNSKARKLALVLTVFSVIGGGSAALIAVNISEFFIKIYIGLIAFSMGLLVYIFRNKCIQFSWPRINLLGFIASFNKGISGAGYGPIITSGQILSGMDSKSSVSISSFTESISCLVALIVYILKLESLHFILVLPLLGGSLASIPFAVRIVKRSKEKNLVVMIGITTITLGVATLIKIFMFR